AQTALYAAREASKIEKQHVDLLLVEMREIETKLAKNRELLEETEKNLIAMEGAIAEKSSRLEVLKQLNDEGQGLAEGSQALLKGLGDPARIQSALAGALATQLDVDPAFVHAIE